MVGIDPGNTKPVSSSEYSLSRQRLVGEGWHYSRAAYYHDAKVPHFVAAAKCWTAPLLPRYAALAAQPRKRGGSAAFIAYLAVWREHFPFIMDEMCRRRWRRDYFARHENKQQALTRFFASIKRGRAEDGTLGDDNVTLVFGNADIASSRRGVRSTPTAAVRQAAILVFGRANVFFEGEYLTSQMDAACGQRLVDVYTTAGPSRRVQGLRDAQQAKFDRYEADVAGRQRAEVDEPDLLADGIMPPRRLFAPRPPRAFRPINLVWGLKYGANPNYPDAGHRLKDRDVNASRNILAAFLARVFGQPRPAYLCPGPRVPPGPRLGYCLPPRLR